jgi:hypothetical protein
VGEAKLLTFCSGTLLAPSGLHSLFCQAWVWSVAMHYSPKCVE